MKRKELLAIFAISALLISTSATNFAFADDSSDDDSSEKMEKERELKKEQAEKLKQEKKELREEYKRELKEKKKILADYKIEMKEKYRDLKKEFKEKYAQLRISTISDIDEDEKIENDIKRKELSLLKLEYREHIKNLKLEAKQHFDELKKQFKSHETDRKNKIHEKINELKVKYKNKIREHKHLDASDLDVIPEDYAGKKIEICHIPPGNPDNAHTLSISVNALRAHLAHDDYVDECESDDETNDQEELEIDVEFEDGVAKIFVKMGDEELEFELEETDRELIIQYIADNTDLTIDEIESYIEFEEETDDGQTIHVELKEELGIAQQ